MPISGPQRSRTETKAPPAVDFEVGGRRYGVFGHDWRATPPTAWLNLLAEREIHTDATPAPRPGPSEEPVVLSQPDFAAAVRAALRDFVRPDLLRGNPLIPVAPGARSSRRQRDGCGPGGRPAGADPAVRRRPAGRPTRCEALSGAASYLLPAGGHARTRSRAPWTCRSALTAGILSPASVKSPTRSGSVRPVARDKAERWASRV